VLETDFGKSLSDSIFRLLLAQLDLSGFENLLRDWMVAQPGLGHERVIAVYDCKSLRGLIDETAS
jgi:hypothetical protein